MLDPQIIFEDDFLVVIDKPAGVVVNRADTTAKTETVQDWAESRIEIGDLRMLARRYAKSLLVGVGLGIGWTKTRRGFWSLPRRRRRFLNSKNSLKAGKW